MAIDQMTDFQCYLPPPATSGPWGFDLCAGGRCLVAPRQNYPLRGHPRGYDFSWTTGRVLRHYALVLIARGGGQFIDHHQRQFEIANGQAFLVVPGCWHAYRPHERTGWEEHWLVFDGPSVQNLLAGAMLEYPVYEPDHGLAAAIDAVLVLLEHQPAGFLVEAEACLARALARLVARHSAVRHDVRHYAAVRRAAARLQEGPVGIAALARECALSPAQFRRHFQAIIGHSPRDYSVLVRLERAKVLLQIPGATVAEVARRTGFNSPSFFSRIFSKHCGCSPRSWQNFV